MLVMRSMTWAGSAVWWRDVEADERVDLPRKFGALEFDTLVVRFLGRLRVDAHGVVTTRAQHRNETAQRAAADVDHSCRRCGQTAAHERPGGRKPSLARRHLQILGLAQTEVHRGKSD
jgi:hypothetical protein